MKKVGNPIGGWLKAEWLKYTVVGRVNKRPSFTPEHSHRAIIKVISLLSLSTLMKYDLMNCLGPK